jgi:hypothetical protein
LGRRLIGRLRLDRLLVKLRFKLKQLVLQFGVNQ